MKNKTWIMILITFLSILVIALVGLMIFLMGGKNHFQNFSFSYSTSKQLIIDEVYEDSFKKIEIIAGASDIDIQKSVNPQIQVKVYGDKDRTAVNTLDNQLIIRSEAKKCFGFCFQREIARIVVYLPENFDQNIEIKNDYGDVKIESFRDANITIDEDCGDVSVLGGNHVNIENHYGDIQVQEATNVELYESAGDIEVGKVEDAVIQNHLGDIQVDAITNYLDIKQDCGNVELGEIILNKDSIISNNLGDIEIGSTNEIAIDAKTDLGDVEIRNNYSKSDITLKIDNSCGDITIRN